MEARVEQVSKEAFNEDDSMQRSGKFVAELVECLEIVNDEAVDSNPKLL